MPDQIIIYEDKYVRITDIEITLFWYYFPFGQNKIIKFSQIKAVKLEELNIFFGKYRLWGMDLKFCFYPLDAKRFQKSNYIMLELGGVIKPSFTSDSIETIYKILTEKI
jgi:hypothetical protein